ncbi:tRNA (guanine(10)-N2)-methyltransferase homolog isoform X2 [Cimex lectularius]|uniref:tRNA (guanine(10)-N(2))-methyltransferase TRMT11 n=1 Tax=Cimex lectularius TaxID=79782 RepID=A0A8I6SF60_CIMLE|nr:tRNA (guanine(10)-N2)-methyltransferase homolog isoform X2 [Cimex lectularius]
MQTLGSTRIYAFRVICHILQEIKSITKLLNIDLKWDCTPEEDPFMIVETNLEENIKQIAKRSVLMRCIVELWSEAKTKDELHKKLKELPDQFFMPYSNPNVSFKVKVEVFGSSQTQQEKIERIESFNYLPLAGPVKLKNPDVALQYIEYFGLNPNKISDIPLNFFFGRIVTDSNRSLITDFSLKKRKFIGNTSMDPQLSFVMANQALVKKGDIILDPFVGTGSLLISAAQFGGYVLGADIDYLMIHGKSRPTRKQDRHKPRVDESIYQNMVQYNLQSQYLDVVVADSSLPLWKPQFTLDAIITDPPYGVREAMERVGSTRDDKKISDVHLKTHIPSKIQYSLTELISDLLLFSVKHLKMGGRLVTWLPVIRCEYEENKLPQHSCLKLVGNSEQILSTTASRRLLTYEKICEPKDDDILKVEEDEPFRKRYQQHVDELRKTKSVEKGVKRKNNENV